MGILEYFANNWKYSNAPEGQRPFEKIVGLTKFGVGGSFMIGSYDCILLSQTPTFWTTVNCMSYWMVPITAMCATFASVAYTSAKLREKDDYFNYALASLACSGIFHRWQKNGAVTCSFTVFLLIAAKIKKHCDLLGIEPIPMGYDVFRVHYMDTLLPDMTLTKDPRGPRPWEK